jgi:hypothetical protein
VGNTTGTSCATNPPPPTAATASLGGDTVGTSVLGCGTNAGFFGTEADVGAGVETSLEAGLLGLFTAAGLCTWANMPRSASTNRTLRCKLRCKTILFDRHKRVYHYYNLTFPEYDPVKSDKIR